jgi:hypothetical protein
MHRSPSCISSIAREDDVLLEERNAVGRGGDDILDDVAIFQRHNATACVNFEMSRIDKHSIRRSEIDDAMRWILCVC